MNKLLGHFRTITRHRHMVMRHCFKCGIPWRGLMHDLSNYSPTEFIPGVKYFTGDKSPTHGERVELGYSKAWMHHKGRNRHHYEYWTDYSMVDKKSMPMKMPLVYVIEMFCDRIAACKVYLKDGYNQGSALDYFNHERGRNDMNPETSKLLGSLLEMLADKGEKETFRYIRKNLRHQKTY